MQPWFVVPDRRWYAARPELAYSVGWTYLWNNLETGLPIDSDSVGYSEKCSIGHYLFCVSMMKFWKRCFQFFVAKKHDSKICLGIYFQKHSIQGTGESAAVKAGDAGTTASCGEKRAQWISWLESNMPELVWYLLQSLQSLQTFFTCF